MKRTPGITDSANSAGESGGAYEAVVIGLGIVVLAVHALGSYWIPGWMWGANAYAFLPGFVFPAALLAAAAGLYVVWRKPLALFRPVSLPAGLGWAAAAAGTFTVFWLARSRQILLGDGIPLLANLPYETTLHAREPLASFLHQRTFALAAWYEPSRDVHEVARDAVALNSALAGVLFLFVAVGLARAITRGMQGQSRGAWRMFLIALFVSQGYAALFFGYIENYALFACGLAAFMWTGILFAQGRAPLLAPIAVLVVTIALHLSAVTVLPGLAALATWGLIDRNRRSGALRDLALGIGLFAAMAWLLFVAGGQYRLDQELLRIVERTTSQAGYMFSADHVRDFFNEHLLIGPFALLWFIPVVLLALLRGELKSAAAVFVAVTAAAQGVACWVVPDLPLGYARDWDLFAPTGVIFVTAAALLALSRERTEFQHARVLGTALVISLFHTVPWVALNASEQRSLERFKSLPLGKGRTESTVGFWYFAQGDIPQATRWLHRALEEDPANVRAMAHLGNIYLGQQRYDLAARAFGHAVELRPNQPGLRAGLISALFALGDYEAGLQHSRIVLDLEPQRATHWAMAGLMAIGLGRQAEARQLLDRAADLDPSEPAYRRAEEDLGAADALAVIVARDWPAFRKE